MDDFHLRQTPYSDPGDLDVSGLPAIRTNSPRWYVV
jgi:hypothetical protein